MKHWILPFGVVAVAGLALPASAPSFDSEQLHYVINWPSGLSLGEATLHGSRVNAKPKSSDHYEFDFNVDAGIPGFRVADKYHSEGNADFCSVLFDKNIVHGSKKTEEKTSFDQQKQTAARETVNGGGKSEVSTPSCAKDALDYLFFVRRELSQGRLPPPQKVFFGSGYETRLEFTGTQMIKVSDKDVEADRLTASVKGPSSDLSFEVFFLKDAARTPALVRVPVGGIKFSMELER